ncbi:cytochrome P450 2D28-like [Branchiostoma lanceolatum]|uniref:cytochrome P450 2D28-like n=1 Tax=Branchiostoma lanceolatum TaxID=7740 RepID=UPI003456015C
MSFWGNMFPAFWSLQVMLLAVLCVIATLVLCGRPRNLPPGPRGLPILGNVLSRMKDPWSYAKWSKKYGDVFTVYFGPKRIIVLHGYSVIREALVKKSKDFSSRPLNQAFLSPDGKTLGKKNIIYFKSLFIHNLCSPLGIVEEPYGPKWKEQRKFAVMSLRDFGLGKRSMEGKILEEARALGDEICKKDGRAFSISQMMQSAVSNVICSIVFGRRYEYDDTTFKDLLESIDRIVYQLFLAGTDKTSTTLRWALLYMILHPDIQEKVQQEIDSVLGPNQEPSMEHRSQMPYTEATLTEVNRLAAVTPLTVQHATSSDTTLRGYNIPKGTAVEIVLLSVHHDPQLWPEPYKFDPTRFINDAGRYVKREEVIPFSIGRRGCLGEQLARMEIFLIFTSLLQRFTFKLPGGAPKPSEEGIPGPLHQPVPFMLVAEPRK